MQSIFQQVLANHRGNLYSNLFPPANILVGRRTTNLLLPIRNWKMKFGGKIINGLPRKNSTRYTKKR